MSWPSFLGKWANTFFLWLDRHQLCPHALVERFLGMEYVGAWDWLYHWGLRVCGWICMRLPPDAS